MEITPGSQEPVLIAIVDIEDNPYQVRTSYDESQITALAASIQDVGLLQVPLARRVGKKYQMAFGHCRKRALEQLLHPDMPLIVLPLTDQEMFEISIAENLKRADLSPLEKADALKRYMDEFKATSGQAARLFGIPAATIRGTVRLLNLPEEAKQKLKTGQISQTQARRILRKPEAEDKRYEPKDGQFDLRENLILLVYDRAWPYVSDELLFKKIREIVEQNKQLQRQVELMNAQRHQGARVPVSPIPRQ